MGSPEVEESLLTRARRGDREAQGALIAAHQERIFNLAYRMTGDSEAAADMTQETFLKALRGLRSYRGGATFHTWLCRIAINCCLSRRRKAARCQEKMPAADEHGSPGHPIDLKDPGPGPDARAQARERDAAVQAAIASLCREHRLVIVLHDIQGNGYNEIAGMLRCPRGTVKSRLHRARMALREKLKGLI